MVNALEGRKLISRKPHPSDGRATGLHLAAARKKLVRSAGKPAVALETDVVSRLSGDETTMLISLLKKVYLPG